MTDSTTPTQGIMFSNKLYDNLKFLVQIILPGLAALYAGLSEFWGFPKVQEVVGTIGVIAVFLGLLLNRSSANFKGIVSDSNPVGTFTVTDLGDGRKAVRLDLDKDPEEFIGNGNITFRTAVEAQSVEEVVFEPDRDENVS